MPLPMARMSASMTVSLSHNAVTVYARSSSRVGHQRSQGQAKVVVVSHRALALARHVRALHLLIHLSITLTTLRWIRNCVCLSPVTKRTQALQAMWHARNQPPYLGPENLHTRSKTPFSPFRTGTSIARFSFPGSAPSALAWLAGPHA